MLHYLYFYKLEKKNTCNKKSQISLLITFTIYFHFLDFSPYISRRLNFSDRTFSNTLREKPKSTKTVKYPREN